MSETIILGYDGSESANAALAETIRLAPKLGAKVIVVFGYYISPLGGTGEGSYREALDISASTRIHRAVADLEAAGVEVEPQIVPGKPAEVIMAVAEEVDAELIVVGTVGEGAIKGTILGSVVLKLIQRAPRPLLIVPTPR